jgi:glycine/D-amino acid oxidase-like deaminating enzyme
LSRKVVIVGGGIVGCVTAYFAARDGLGIGAGRIRLKPPAAVPTFLK